MTVFLDFIQRSILCCVCFHNNISLRNGSVLCRILIKVIDVLDTTVSFLGGHQLGTHKIAPCFQFFQHIADGSFAHSTYLFQTLDCKIPVLGQTHSLCQQKYRLTADICRTDEAVAEYRKIGSLVYPANCIADSFLNYLVHFLTSFTYLSFHGSPTADR